MKLYAKRVEIVALLIGVPIILVGIIINEMSLVWLPVGIGGFATAGARIIDERRARSHLGKNEQREPEPKQKL